MKLPITMKPIVMKMLFGAVALSVAASSAAQGQNVSQNAQWNALFDRIIRLEANVKNLANNGGGGGYAQTQSNDQIRQMLNEVRQMRQQLQTMDARLRRLEQNSGRSGAVAPRVPAPRQLGQAPRQLGQAPRQLGQAPRNSQVFAETDLNRYDVNNEPQIFVEFGDPKETPNLSQGVPVAPIARTPGSWQNKAPGRVGAVPQANRQANTQIARLPPQNGDTIVPGGVERQTLDGNQVTTASVAKKLYDRSRAALRSRRYGAAESGFKSFLRKYGKHNLAPNAQFMLGETYYVQANYRLAAQTYLQGYRKFPKARRSSDTLLKLGMSMGKLGQKSQSCGVFESVVSKYKSSNSAVKRAKKEMKRARC